MLRSECYLYVGVLVTLGLFSPFQSYDKAQKRVMENVDAFSPASCHAQVACPLLS